MQTNYKTNDARCTIVGWTHFASNKKLYYCWSMKDSVYLYGWNEDIYFATLFPNRMVARLTLFRLMLMSNTTDMGWQNILSMNDVAIYSLKHPLIQRLIEI